MVDANLGRKEEAVREGRRACELLPLSVDAWRGPTLILNLATIYAWTGDKDRAIEQLMTAAKVPNSAHYGELKLNPHGTRCAATRISKKSSLISRRRTEGSTLVPSVGESVPLSRTFQSRNDCARHT